MIHFFDSGLFPAHANVAHQLEQHQLYLVSLEAMWRAVGSPEGRDPQAWLGLVGDLVRGMTQYIEGLEDCILLVDGRRDAVWSWPEYLDPQDDWQAGDTLAIPPLAGLYALWLDGPGV